MADIIWAELRVQTDKSKKEVQSLNKEISTTGKVAKKSGDEATKAYNQQAVAANKAAGSQNAVQKAIGGVNKGVSSLTSNIGQVAGAMGVAFGTQQVIQFAKASVEAFVEAEKNSQLLLFSLKGNVTAQQQLIDQAKKLQNTTVFDDDSIIQAQTFLATQGRTPAQIQKVIDAAVQLSTVLGTDLQTSVMQLDGTFEGNAGRLRKLDADFKELTEEQLRNGAAVDLVIEKYKGQAEAMGETSAGQMQKLKNQYGELQESIGEQLLPSLNGLMAGLEALSKGNFAGGIDGLTKAMEFGVPQIQEFREAFKAFAKGDFWGGLANTGEAVLSTITFGMYTRVKNYFTPAKDEYIDGLTAMDKKTFEIIASTEAQIKAERDRLEAMGGSTKAFDEFVTKVRTAELDNIFNQLNQSLDITRKQFERLVGITDRYGISTMVASDAILRLKAANGDELQKTFENMHTRLGVSKKDWDEYLGILEEIPPKHEEVEGTLKQLPGPYDTLTAAVSRNMKALQDQVTLFSQGKGTWADAIKLAEQYAKTQNELVYVNDLVTDSLKRQTHEGLLPLADANQFVLVTERQLVERFQFTEEMMRKRDEIFQQIGVHQIDIYKKTLEELQKLQEEEIRASDGTLKSIMEINEKYTKAITVMQLQQSAELAGAFAGVAKNLTGLLTNIFGEAAQKNVSFLAFTKSIAIAEITLSSYQAIAAGIAKLASTNPLDIIGGISAIIGGVSNFIGGLISQVENTNTPSVPAFEKGTGYVTRGNNPQGVDTVPALLTEGEGVVTRRANANYPGLVDALNMGLGDDYIMRHFVEPVLRAEEKDFPDQLAASLAMQKGFDDFRLYRTGKEQSSLLRENNTLLRKHLAQNRNNRNVN